jgi:hypothetical protein
MEIGFSYGLYVINWVPKIQKKKGKKKKVNSVKKILDAVAIITVTKPKCGPKLLIN